LLDGLGEGKILAQKSILDHEDVEIQVLSGMVSSQYAPTALNPQRKRELQPLARSSFSSSVFLYALGGVFDNLWIVGLDLD